MTHLPPLLLPSVIIPWLRWYLIARALPLSASKFGDRYVLPSYRSGHGLDCRRGGT